MTDAIRGNAMIIARLRGAERMPATAESNADPRNPNLHDATRAICAPCSAEDANAGSGHVPRRGVPVLRLVLK